MTRTETTTFGPALRRFRLAAGLTQEEIAERCGLSVRGISDLERGVNVRPRRDTIELLVQALSLTGPDRSVLEEAARVPKSAVEVLDQDDDAYIPFVGREYERGALADFLDGRGPPALLIAGEPGIGKTRILQEAMAMAATAGKAVLIGGCQRRGGQEPFTPISDAISRYLTRLPPSRQRAVLAGCAWLVHIVPELSNILPVPDVSIELEKGQERRLAFGAVAHLLTNLGGPAGTILVLDDVQWAPSDALDLLMFLLVSSSTRAIVSFRATEAEDNIHLRTTLADLAHRALATFLSLGPLEIEQARVLFHHLLRDVDARHALEEECLRRSEGVPFFLVSYARLAARQPASTTASIPWNVQHGIQQRAGALGQEAKYALEVAAVIGRVVPGSLVIEVLGAPEEDVLANLDAACHAALLRGEGGTEYAFAHDLIREAIESGTGPGRRALLHRRVAEALERRASGSIQPRAAELAWHYLEAGELERALVYAKEAADVAAESFAHDEAERHYRIALTLAQRLRVPAVREGSIRLALANVLVATGRVTEVDEVLKPALAGFGAAGDLEGQARVVLHLAHCARSQGRFGDALELIRPMIQKLESAGGSVEVARLYLLQAWILIDKGDFQNAGTCLERAMTLSVERQDAEMQRAIGSARRYVLSETGQSSREARFDWEAKVEVALAEDNIGALMDAFEWMGREALARGELHQAESHLGRSLGYAHQTGSATAIAFVSGLLGYVLTLLGRWDDAERHLQEGHALLRERSLTWPYNCQLDLGFLLFCRGDWVPAERYLQEAFAVSRQMQDLVGLRISAERLARLDICRGRPQDAIERLIPLLDRPDLEELRVTALLPTLALAYGATDDLRRAAEVSEQALRRIQGAHDDATLPWALVVRARVLSRLARHGEAAEAVEQALSLARSVGMPYFEALALAEQGRLLAARGMRDESHCWFEAALEIFRHLGAIKDLETVEQELARLVPASGA